MSENGIFDAELCCHPDTSCPAVETLRAAISWVSERNLKVVYTVRGAIDDLRIPPLEAPRRADRLWRHTCFELFLGAQNDVEYYEFNFSPSGEWAAYGFRAYREGMALEGAEPIPKINVERGADGLVLSATLSAGSLPGITPNIRLSLGVCAVLEDRAGALSYWALRHPAGKPDFHHAEGFTLELAVPG